MIRALRWGRSAYETEADLRAEVEALHALGVLLECSESGNPSLDGVVILVVTSGVKVDEEVLLRAESLRLVLTTTSGFDHIDVSAARSRGIMLGRCPNARRDAVVDTSIAMGMGIVRAIPQLQRRAESGIWARDELPKLAPRRVLGLKVGVVGAGVIGQKAIEQWQSLGAEVRFHDPARSGSIALDALCQWVDLLTLHCSLGPGSKQLLNAERIGRLRAGTVVINTARGDCIDLDALFAATHLGGVGLDVFAQEPPLELEDWASRENVFLTPHAAGFHPQMADEVCQEIAAAVEAFLSGKELPAPL